MVLSGSLGGQAESLSPGGTPTSTLTYSDPYHHWPSPSRTADVSHTPAISVIRKKIKNIPVLCWEAHMLSSLLVLEMLTARDKHPQALLWQVQEDQVPCQRSNWQPERQALCAFVENIPSCFCFLLTPSSPRSTIRLWPSESSVDKASLCCAHMTRTLVIFGWPLLLVGLHSSPQQLHTLLIFLLPNLFLLLPSAESSSSTEFWMSKCPRQS